jgi:4-(gamma-glutamylamino)butanal dehydrogenase
MSAQVETCSWAQRAAARKVDGRPLIEGRMRDPVTDRVIDVVNPATACVEYQIPACGAADIDAAVSSARVAFDDGRWPSLQPMERRALLLNFARLVDSNADDLALDDTLDMGKPITVSLAEAPIAGGFIRFNAEAIDKAFGAVVSTPVDCVEFQVHEPRGVIGAIVPWNFPVINAALKLGPALAAGNTVVLKPSELAPASALRLGRLALEAGIPAGVFNIVPGDGEAGRALASHPATDMVAFTGSTPTGRAVLEAIGGSRLKPALLECGGKSPQVVFDDAEDFGIQQVVEALVRDALWNSGQVCVARTRLLIQEGIYLKILDAGIAAFGARRSGDPLSTSTSLGPLVCLRQADRVRQYIHLALKEGATQLLPLRGELNDDHGCYIHPVVLAPAGNTSTIVQQEVFGPVVTVQRFRDEDEALALANSTAYGLAASVWTSSLSRGLRLARRIRSGTVHVMGQAAASPGSGFAHSAEPRGQSGYGVEGGLPGLLSYTALKSIRLTGA